MLGHCSFWIFSKISLRESISILIIFFSAYYIKYTNVSVPLFTSILSCIMLIAFFSVFRIKFANVIHFKRRRLYVHKVLLMVYTYEVCCS